MYATQSPLDVGLHPLLTYIQTYWQNTIEFFLGGDDGTRIDLTNLLVTWCLKSVPYQIWLLHADSCILSLHKVRGIPLSKLNRISFRWGFLHLCHSPVFWVFFSLYALLKKMFLLTVGRMMQFFVLVINRTGYKAVGNFHWFCSCIPLWKCHKDGNKSKGWRVDNSIDFDQRMEVNRLILFAGNDIIFCMYWTTQCIISHNMNEISPPPLPVTI